MRWCLSVFYFFFFVLLFAHWCGTKGDGEREREREREVLYVFFFSFDFLFVLMGGFIIWLLFFFFKDQSTQSLSCVFVWCACVCMCVTWKKKGTRKPTLWNSFAAHIALAPSINGPTSNATLKALILNDASRVAYVHGRSALADRLRFISSYTLMHTSLCARIVVNISWMWVRYGDTKSCNDADEKILCVCFFYYYWNLVLSLSLCVCVSCLFSLFFSRCVVMWWWGSYHNYVTRYRWKGYRVLLHLSFIIWK